MRGSEAEEIQHWKFFVCSRWRSVIAVPGAACMADNLCANPYKADMAQMNVSIPDRLKRWAEQRVAEGRYSSTSDYVRDLIRRDEEREAILQREIERLRSAWEEGLASGPAVDAPDDWADQVIARGEARRRGTSDAA